VGVTIQHDKLSNTISLTKVANRDTIILKSRLDTITVKLLEKKLKSRLFTKIGFLKPKSKEVRLITVDKYYEPYIVVGGKYAIDYSKSRVSTNDKARFHYENKAHCVLDMMGHEIDPKLVPFSSFRGRTLEELARTGTKLVPFSSSKGRTLEELARTGTKLVEVKISSEEEIGFLRSKIVNRPSDVGEVIEEIFEVSERVLIYFPMYQLTFRNVKTGKDVIAKIDGITGKMILSRFDKAISSKFIRNFLKVHSKNSPRSEGEITKGELGLQQSQPILEPDGLKKIGKDLKKKTIERKDSRMLEIEERIEFPAQVAVEVFRVGDNVTGVAGNVEIPSGTTVSKSLKVKGHLKIGTDCRIFGKVKALKDVTIGANTTIDGDVISGGKVVIGSDSVIHGSVESAEHVEIGENAIIEGGLHSKFSVVLDRYARVYGANN
jgi:cytoskeletal protein CcmA (bactofilin family)